MTKSALHVVDENEAGLGHPLPLRLHQIERFEGQPRRFFDPKKIEDLADSIQANGQKTAVRVCKHPDKPGIFVLIDGERRWRAFHLIEEHTGNEPIVNALIDASPRSFQDHFKEAMIGNLHREDLIPLDEAAAYHQMNTDGGMSKADISRMVGKSYAYVDNYIRMHTLPDEVKKLMDPVRPKEDRLSITAAIEIARSIPNAELQITVARESIERALGTTETRTLIRVMTGKSGYGIGGRMRRPSDDYKVFTSFLARTSNRVKQFHNDLSVADLYFSRDDEAGDRERDERSIRMIIHYFNALLVEIEEK